MKNSAKITSLILAAGAAGVALFKIANASFTAVLPGDALFAIAASVAIVSFAAYDYSRRGPSLRMPSRALHPSLPAGNAAHSTAYGIKSSSKNRVAA
jgi:hypothetical protein